MSIKEEIGHEMLDIRTVLDLTQEAAVELFNATEPLTVRITRNDLAKYETGVNMPSAVVYKKYLRLKR